MEQVIEQPPVSTEVLVIGKSPEGHVIASGYGQLYYLTACCGASAKGSGEGLTVCRCCYREVPGVLGGLPTHIGETYYGGIPWQTYAEQHGWH